VVDDSAHGLCVEVYKESAPSVQGSYGVLMPAGKQWRFRHWIYRGNAHMDDYQEFGAGTDVAGCLTGVNEEPYT
jgi:hypothetical protein